MIITFETEFEIGQIVYHRTDIGQGPYVVTEYLLGGHDVAYACSADGVMSRFKPIELSAERNEALVLQFGD